MFGICTRSRLRPMRLLGVAGMPLALTVTIAGCGSSSSSSNAHQATVAAQTAPSRVGRTSGIQLTLRASEYGPTIFDAHHRVLYLFAADRGPKSTCYGACAAAWPPLHAKGAPTAGAGLNAKLLGTTTRRDGTLQVTYGGHPLYYYSGDMGSHIMCQHANMHGGFWYVVKANGKANLAKGKTMM